MQTSDNVMMDRRVAKLEARVFGRQSAAELSSEQRMKDVASILDELESEMQSKIPKSLVTDLKEIQRLQNELHPGCYLTHQLPSSSSNKPLLYRHEEILASSEQLQRCFKELAELKELLLLHGNAKSQHDLKPLSMAPILNSPIYATTQSADFQKRVDKIMHRTARNARQAEQIASRIDSLVDGYHASVLAMSKKIVLMEEERYSCNLGSGQCG